MSTELLEQPFTMFGVRGMCALSHVLNPQNTSTPSPRKPWQVPEFMGRCRRQRTTNCLGRSRTVARSRTFKPLWHMLLWPDLRAAPRERSVLDVNSSRQSQFPPNVVHPHEPRDPHVQRMFGTSTRPGFRRGCGPASWRPPSDLVDQVHVSRALSGACTGKGPQMANPRPTPKPENFGPR